jgi:hypothetical protein
MKWKEHLDDAYNTGKDAGIKQANYESLVATFVSALILGIGKGVVENTDAGQDIKKSVKRFFRRLFH